MWMLRGHNECGTVCGFNPQNNILSLATAPGLTILWHPLHIMKQDIHLSSHFQMTSRHENDISWLQKQTWQIESAAHFRTRRGSAVHQLLNEIGKKTAVCVNIVIYSLMSEKEAALYERKIPTAIGSRGSIRSGSSVGFGRSVSNRHQQHQEWYFYQRGRGCNKEKYVEKWRKANF